MGVHAAALSPMHTCVRLCAPTMRLSPSRAHVWVRPPVYIANAHVNVQYIYVHTYTDAKSGYVNGYGCVF